MNDFVQQAVILAGGRGERLRPLTDHLPKPMAPVLEHPFLDYLLYSLAHAGITKVLLLVGYKQEKIVERYKNHPKLKIEFSIGKAEDETLQRILQAKEQLDERFMLLYGDNYWPIEFGRMKEFYLSGGKGCTTTVFNNSDGTAEYGSENNIQVAPDSTVLRYDKLRSAPGLNGVDIGYFILEKSALDGKFGPNPSMERELLPKLVEKKALRAFRTDLQYYYITSLETLKSFEGFARQQKLKVIGDL